MALVLLLRLEEDDDQLLVRHLRHAEELGVRAEDQLHVVEKLLRLRGVAGRADLVMGALRHDRPVLAPVDVLPERGDRGQDQQG
jgi:hypothetical protein